MRFEARRSAPVVALMAGAGFCFGRLALLVKELSGLRPLVVVEAAALGLQPFAGLLALVPHRPHADVALNALATGLLRVCLSV